MDKPDIAQGPIDRFEFFTPRQHGRMLTFYSIGEVMKWREQQGTSHD